jgi:hypothetical protein
VAENLRQGEFFMSIEKDEEIENKSRGKEISCYCNQCKNDIKHIVLLDYYESNHEIVDSYFNKGQLFCNSIYWSTDHQIIKCVGCDTISYRAERWFSEYQDFENIGNNAVHEFATPSKDILTSAFKVIEILLRAIFELPKEGEKVMEANP